MGKPRQLAVIDCETDPFAFGRVPKPFLWDVYDGVTHYTFTEVCDVVHFLLDKHWTVYAHNGGRFDYCMPGFLDELEPFAKVMMINGRLARFTLGDCEFRDSYSILPVPLSAYKKDDIDYALFEPTRRRHHMDAITRYLHGDTEYLYQLVSAFRQNYGAGLTLAGTAMKVWQERARVEAPQSTKGFYKQVEPFYHGGRVECFRLGMINEPFRMIDINSAYPYAMLHEHPISTEVEEVYPDVQDAIIPQSLYQVDFRANGSLPCTDELGSLSFPSDGKEYTSHCTGWEVQAARDTGACIVRIKRRLDFDKTINFSKYIHHFYDLKKEAAKVSKNSPDYIFAKLFMNSLYGKFGANPEEYSNFEVMEPKYHDAACAEGYVCKGELGKWIVMGQDLLPEQERYYNVATAASITGFVRAYLWKALSAIRRATGTPFYCDTDSITFGGMLPSREVACGSDLGQWSEEGHFDRGGIGGKKLYAFHKTGTRNEWKQGCKGVRITPQDILKVCAGKTVTYKRDAPTLGVGKERQAGETNESYLKRMFCVRKVRMTGKTK